MYWQTRGLLQSRYLWWLAGLSSFFLFGLLYPSLAVQAAPLMMLLACGLVSVLALGFGWRGGLLGGLAITLLNALFYRHTDHPFADYFWVIHLLIISGGSLLGRVRDLTRRLTAAQKESEAELIEYRENLADQVKARTAQLAEANTSLQQEVAECSQLKAALQQSEQTTRDFLDYLRALHEIITTLANVPDLDAFYQQMIHLGITHLGFDRLGFFLLSEDNTLLSGTYGTDVQGQIVPEYHLQIALSDDDYRFSLLESTDRIRAWHDVEIFYEKQFVGKGWNAIATVQSGDIVHGWLSADNLINGRPLEPCRQELLALYASSIGHLLNAKQVTQALKNSEQTALEFQDYLRTLHEISIVLSSISDLDGFYHQVIELGRNRLGFERMGLWLLAEDGSTLTGTYGIDDQGQIQSEYDLSFSLDDPSNPSRHLFDVERVQVWHDTPLYHYHQKVGQGWNAAAVLQTDGSAQGWLTADNLLEGGALEPYRMELLALYSSTVGNLLHKRQITQALQQSEQTALEFQDYLRILHELTISLADTPDLDTFYRQAVELGITRLGFDRMGFWLLAEDGDTLSGTYGTDDHGQIQSEYDQVYSISTGEAFHYHRNYERGQVQVWQNKQLYHNMEATDKFGWNLLATIHVQDTMLGWFSADNFLNGRPLEPYRTKLLSLYGAIVGYLLKNKQVTQALQQSEQTTQSFLIDLKNLHNVTIQLQQTANDDNFWRQVIQLGRDSLDFSRLGVFMLNPDGRTAHGIYGISVDGQLRNETHIQVDLEGNDWVVSTLESQKKCTIWHDTTLYEDCQPVATGWNGIAAIMAGDQALGWLVTDNLISREPVMPPHRLELLGLYGSTIGHIYSRRQAEAKLLMIQNRYQAMFDRSMDAIFILSLEGMHLEINQRAVDLLGYATDEIVGLSIQDTVIPEELHLADERHKALLAGETLPIYERIFRHKDGTPIPVELNAMLVRDQAGTPLYIQSIVRDLRQRKQAEAALWTSQNRYQAMVSRSTDAVFILSLDGQHLEANQQAADLLGYTQEEILQLSVKDTVIPDEHPNAHRRVAALAAGETLPIHERTFHHKDGTLIPAEVNAMLVRDKDGTPLYIQSIVRDLRQRKQAEAALWTSQNRYQAMFNHSMDAIFILSLEGIQLEVNQRAADLLGYTREEITGLPTEVFIMPGEYKQAKDRREALLAGETLPLYERIFRHKDGTPIPVELNAMLVHDQAGTPLYIQSIVRDLRQRKQAEAALWTSQNRYQALLNRSRDLVFIMDLHGIFVEINQQAADLLAYKPEELIGMPMHKIIISEEAADAEDRLAEIFAGKTVDIYERTLQCKDGTPIPVEINLMLVRDRQGQPEYVQSIVRDITNRKRAEAALKYAYTRLQELDHLRGEFVTNVSHELRTPITNLKLYHRLLEARPQNSLNYLETLRRETERLQHIVEDLLYLAQLDQQPKAYTLHPVNLDDLAGNLVHDRVALAERSSLSLTFTPQTQIVLQVAADAAEIVRAISILLDNATAYTPKGGEIMVKTLIQVDENGQQWGGVQVSDSGPGIPLDEQPHIFERFFRGKDYRETGHIPGTGLGLSIAHEIIERHQGKITVTSTGIPGEGVTFTLLLPVYQEP